MRSVPNVITQFRLLVYKKIQSNQVVIRTVDIIYKNSALFHAIQDKCADIVLEPAGFSEDLVQIRNKPGQFIKLEFIFCNHQQNIKGESMQEMIDFWVFRKGNTESDGTIFRKTIPIEANDFIDLIQAVGSEHRDEKLLAIAKELTENYM